MVNFSNAAVADAEEEVWGALQGRSIKTLTFSQKHPGTNISVPMPVGSFYEGVTKEAPSRRQATDPETKLPRTYRDGNPIYDIILVLDTAYRDENDTEDDGTRRIYLNGIGQRALQDEMRRLGITKFGIGTKVRWELTGFKSNGQGRQDSKLQKITLEPVEWTTPNQAATQQALAAAVVPQQQYVTPAQPAFAGQVVPQQVVPQPAPQPVAAPVAPAQQVAQQVAAAAASGFPTAEQIGQAVAQANLLITNGFTRDQAVAAVSAMPGSTVNAATLEENLPL